MKSKRPRRLHNDKVLTPDVYSVPQPLVYTRAQTQQNAREQSRLQSLSSVSRRSSSASSKASHTGIASVNQSSDFRVADRALTLISCIRGSIQLANAQLCRAEKYWCYCYNLQENVDILCENVDILFKQAEFCVFTGDGGTAKSGQKQVAQDDSKWWRAW